MINDLEGKTLININVLDDQIIFYCTDGKVFIMQHLQNCCEDVYIEDICGDINDLLNSPILSATCRTNDSDTNKGIECWTFYHINTNKGGVVIRWFGHSNGYYSIGVNFCEKDND